MYKIALRTQQRAADEAAQKGANNAARKRKAARAQIAADRAAKNLALALNRQQEERTAAMMANYRAKTGRTRTT